MVTSSTLAAGGLDEFLVDVCGECQYRVRTVRLFGFLLLMLFKDGIAVG